jgi:hypothetical protein
LHAGATLSFDQHKARERIAMVARMTAFRVASEEHGASACCGREIQATCAHFHVVARLCDRITAACHDPANLSERSVLDFSLVEDSAIETGVEEWFRPIFHSAMRARAESRTI